MDYNDENNKDKIEDNWMKKVADDKEDNQG